MASLIQSLLPEGLSWERVFSVHWWLESLLHAYREDPNHVLVELVCVVIILYLLFRPSYDPAKAAQLDKREEDELIAQWKPEPLCPEEDPRQAEEREEQLVLESAAEPEILVNGRKCLNFASDNFLGLANNEEVKRACEATIVKYGVGSCGPRGFYGSIDVHLHLEQALAKLYGSEQAIVYSDGLGCVCSVIPAFVKRGDLIICDEDCHYGIQQGIGLSRSNVLYFKHNDMQDLQRVLADVKEKDELRPPTKLNRRFIIVEGLYQKHGDLAPLDKIVELKKDYKYRLILDDSLAIGVLGRTGRGSPEHWGVPFSEVEILTATLDHAVGSAGGFCVGSAQVVDHQRLSGLGYCFSASAPPYVSTAAITALAVMEREPQRLRALAANAKALRDGLRQIPNVTFVGDDCSPVVHLRLKKSAGSREYDEVFWKIVAEKLLRESSIVVIVPKYIPGERKLPEPSLRISVMAAHKRAEIEQLLKKLRAAIEAASKL